MNAAGKREMAVRCMTVMEKRGDCERKGELHLHFVVWENGNELQERLKEGHEDNGARVQKVQGCKERKGT
jgi:hypothetical protein